MKRSVLLFCCAIASCAEADVDPDAVRLDVITVPAGATVTVVGTEAHTIAPGYITYSKTHSLKDAEGCMITPPLGAVWPSGAKQITDPVQMCGGAASYSIVIHRPIGPGQEMDNRVARQYELSRQAPAPAYDPALNDFAEDLGYFLGRALAQ